MIGSLVPRASPMFLASMALATACGGTDSTPRPPRGAMTASQVTSSIASTSVIPSASAIAAAPSSAEAVAGVIVRVPSRLKGMPDVHVDLEPPVARPATVCSIHGSDRPFDSRAVAR